MSTITLVYTDAFGYIPEDIKKEFEKMRKRQEKSCKCNCGKPKPPKK